MKWVEARLFTLVTVTSRLINHNARHSASSVQHSGRSTQTYLVTRARHLRKSVRCAATGVSSIHYPTSSSHPIISTYPLSHTQERPSRSERRPEIRPDNLSFVTTGSRNNRQHHHSPSPCGCVRREKEGSGMSFFLLQWTHGETWRGGLVLYAEPPAKVLSQTCKQIAHAEKEQRGRAESWTQDSQPTEKKKKRGDRQLPNTEANKRIPSLWW